MSSPDPNLEKMAALGRITRALIHDFNNSLSSIMGHADFLMFDLPEGSEQHQFAENIKRAALQLQDSLDQIRSFAADEKKESLVPHAFTPPVQQHPHPSKSILLVEDREIVLHTIEIMLHRSQHHVEAVTDGFLALDMIRENPKKYDILITDYSMPELNGKDLLEEIRQDFKNLPVIIMSGDQESLKNLHENKANKNIFILSKPITATALQQTIELAYQHAR